jgi:hypothetical protein
MSNEFNIKNGFISKGDGLINGGLTTQTLTITSGATNGYVLTSNVSGNATWKDLNSILPYKVYTALLTQTGTTEPTAIVLENTLGPITFVYNGTGTYAVLSSGLFTTNKTAFFITPNNAGTGGGTAIQALTPSQANLWSYLTNTGFGIDGVLNTATLEIRVYN